MGQDPRRWRTFLTQCLNLFQAKPVTFQLDNICIAFTTSYIQSITFDHYTALLWFEPHSPVLSNWQSFINEFSTKFGVFDTMAEAEDNLFNLRMRPDKRFTTFIVHFEKEAYETGWNYNMLRYGLPPKQPTYEGYKALVIQVDQRYWEDCSEYSNTRTQWNAGGQTWQPGVPNNTTNSWPPNPTPPATPGAQPPFVRNPINNNQTLGPQPLAQLNASDTIKALELNPDEPIDPDALIDDSAFPEDEEALRANRFRSSNKPWIDVQERRQKEGACILCGERGHFIGECPKCPTMGCAVWTFEGKECEYQFAEHDLAD
ncbi:hypothetical protein C0992_001020 [Termitomyces sp. T32_za158]|nr:hypothetical protein C0992_001020 [Termitomyces sp. T32_za158]